MHRRIRLHIELWRKSRKFNRIINNGRILLPSAINRSLFGIHIKHPEFEELRFFDVHDEVSVYR